MKFDRKKFFDAYRTQFGTLKAPQVDGLEAVLGFIEADSGVTDVRHVAYMLATMKHECADSWHPIEEFGKGKGLPYGQPYTVPLADDPVKTRQVVYYGRGNVQLTWQKNYAAMSKALGMGQALVLRPELALDPAVAYKIMSFGMRNGSFTGRKLEDYIADQCDYVGARRIINGQDCAGKIAGYATALERCSREAM